MLIALGGLISLSIRARLQQIRIRHYGIAEPIWWLASSDTVQERSAAGVAVTIRLRGAKGLERSTVLTSFHLFLYTFS